MAADSSASSPAVGGSRIARRERLASRRKALGLTQEDLAALLSVERSTVRRWEHGETAPAPWMRPRLAMALKVSADQLTALLDGDAPGAMAGRGNVRYSLPPDTAAFTGRSGELDRITAAVAGAAQAGGVVSVGAIDGMPGVGKTALAIRVAHLLADQFPDRQLFIDLHGHTPGREPVAPGEALAGLLAAAGVDPRFVPQDLDGRAALWRDRMAGQRALLVLDNAASSAQVAPLLPGGGDCLVLVTSRRHLGDLPAVTVPVLLDVLPAEQAAAMFTGLAPRAAADAAGVAEVVRLAGCLPLAVSLLARVFARHPTWTLADLAADTRAGLLTVTAEQGSVAAAFELSYRHLDPTQQKLFGLLGLHPGGTVDGYAAAALAGISLAEAGRLLDQLHQEGLLTETGYRRYGMHDLLRRYARDRAAADPRTDPDQALDRLLDYYQHTAALAQQHLARQTRTSLAPTATAAQPETPGLEDDGQALAWARAERDSLLACLDHVTRSGQHAQVTALTAAAAELLLRDGPWAEAITRHETALRSARNLDDRLGEADALSDLAAVRRLTGDYQGAAGDLERALAIYRESGDQRGQANALGELAALRSVKGDYRGVVGDLEQALVIYRDLGDRRGQANALTDLGIALQQTGDYRAAAGDLDQALVIYREVGDRRGQANALRELGSVRRLTGDYRGAEADLEQALVIFRELGDRLGQAGDLFYLGTVRGKMGDRRAAGDLDQALAIYRDLGSRRGQGNALLFLGTVRRDGGDYRRAAGDLEQALAIFRDLGERRGQANTQMYLGSVRRAMGDYPRAAGDLEQALAIFRDLGDRGGEAEVLNERGTLHRLSGDPAEAEACHQQALELARAIGSDWDEAHALAGLGRCAAAAGRTAQAETLLRQAHEIFKRIGVADAPAVLAELNALAAQA